MVSPDAAFRFVNNCMDLGVSCFFKSLRAFSVQIWYSDAVSCDVVQLLFSRDVIALSTAALVGSSRFTSSS